MKKLALLIVLLCLGCVGPYARMHKGGHPPGDALSGHARHAGAESSAPLVGAVAPDFRAWAVMPDDTFKEISLQDYRGEYVILFFYPGDFTFICPTEVIAFDERLAEFRERECRVIACSVDSRYVHAAWKETHPDDGGIGNIRYPLIADETRAVSRAFNVLLEDKVALRGLFLIDKQGRIRHAVINSLEIGRDVGEALRALDAVRFVDEHKDLCPANWQLGQEGIKVEGK